MIPLSPRLDDIAFDGLLALARDRLPALAPEWTDYNHHDPGIMLIELLAWVADTQIYSLARNRTDERLAMARLLGVRPRGAIPAKGVVYPAEPALAARTIPADSVLKPARDAAPRLETSAEVNLLPVEIGRVATEWRGGAVIDHTAVNARARATFMPFGEKGDGALRIVLKLRDGAQAPDGPGPVLLSLGFQVEGSGPAAPAHRFGRVDAFDANDRPLARRRDTTCGLQRSGVMIFALDPQDLAAPIILRAARGYALVPRLVQVAPNALPVAQRATFRFADYRGNGRPGQTIEIAPSSIFAADELSEDRVWRLCEGNASIDVRISEGQKLHGWRRGKLDSAGRDDRRFSFDERPDGRGLRVRFGNGINGGKPGLDETIALSIRLGCGLQGNVRHPIEWLIDGQGTRWFNPGSIEGGKNAQDARAALAEVRTRLRDNRVLATSAQIAAAVKALGPALGVVRAEVEQGWERGRKRPATPATRTLIVGHATPGLETAAWRRTIAHALLPDVPIGERVIVAAPVYRSFGVTVKASAAIGSSSDAVADAIRAMIAKRFTLTRAIPLSRDVDASAVAGWVRRVDGVAHVGAVTLSVDGRAVDRLKVGRGELPRFVGPAAVTMAEGRE